jgi:hypothetical protein
MSNEVNVVLFGSGVIVPPTQTHHWFWDFAPRDYNLRKRRVRTFSVVPYVYVDDSGGTGLPVPEPLPAYEQRVEISKVFHLVKANTAQMQVNVIVRSLTPNVPVGYVLMMAETDN